MPRTVSILTEADAHGGSVVHTFGLIEALVDRGCEVEVVANRFDPYTIWARERGLADRVRVIPTALPGITPEQPADLAGWSAVFGQLRGDVMFFPKGHFFHGRLEFLALCRSRFRTIAFIEHLEAPAAPAIPPPLLGFIPRPGLAWRRRRARQRRAAGYADHIIAVSDKVRDRLVADWGAPPERIAVVRNGVRWRDFARDEEAGARFRAAHGVAPGTFVFGMMTRLARVKGIDLALRALRRVVDAAGERDVRLVVAGEGPEGEALRALAVELGVDRHVCFAGPVTRPVEAYSAYDVILFSSRFEGLPLALLEGMAAGCIPVVADVGGMKEAVNSPAAGWLVTPEDPAVLADAMLATRALDPARVRTLREAVVRRVREEFDADVCFRAILDRCGIPAGQEPGPGPAREAPAPFSLP